MCAITLICVINNELYVIILYFTKYLLLLKQTTINSICKSVRVFTCIIRYTILSLPPQILHTIWWYIIKYAYRKKTVKFEFSRKDKGDREKGTSHKDLISADGRCGKGHDFP